jgi:hypothetical protein
MRVDPAIRSEIQARVLRQQLGDGDSWLVRPTRPPSLAVEVATGTLPISASSVVLPRIDTIAMRPGPAGTGWVDIIAIHGTPAPCPVSPVCPGGYIPIAFVTVFPNACTIRAENIAECRP